LARRRVGGCPGNEDSREAPARNHRKADTVKITVNAIAVSPLALRLGLTLKYTDHGPIRFHLLDVPWDVFDPQTTRDLVAAASRVREAADTDEPLF